MSAVYAALVMIVTYITVPVTVSAQGEEVDICGSGASACNRFIDTYINPFIVLLTVMVGIAAVISIVMAGVQYSSSADDPSAVTKAKQRVLSTVIGLVAYIFLLAFLNYLVPGGLF
jgi:heme/copper-type cytochrome/quinol oxidase subunit 2